jgi:hypothetical protein
MSWKDRQLGQSKSILVTGSPLTITGTPTTNGVQPPNGNAVALIQNCKLSDWVSTGEVWRPLGIQLLTTTSSTVTPPVFQIQKDTAGNNTPLVPTSGGVTTASAIRTAPFGEYLAFSSYVSTAGVLNFAALDAAGDKWFVKNTVSSTAGAVMITLHYACINVAGISDAVTTL